MSVVVPHERTSFDRADSCDEEHEDALQADSRDHHNASSSDIQEIHGGQAAEKLAAGDDDDVVKWGDGANLLDKNGAVVGIETLTRPLDEETGQDGDECTTKSNPAKEVAICAFLK